MAYHGPSRVFRVPALDVANDQATARRQALSRASDEARSAGASFASSVRDMNERNASDENEAAQLATEPGVRRLSPALSGPSALDTGTPLTQYSSDSDYEAEALKPKRFTRAGSTYEYNPRVSLALDRARTEQRNALDFEYNQTKKGGLDLAEDDARVERLVQAGFSPRDAARSIFARGQLSYDEQRDVASEKSRATMARDQALQAMIGERQQAAAAARQNVQQLLERSRSGDRAASRELRAAMGILESTQRAAAQASRERQSNMLGPDMGGMGGIDDEDPTVAAAREHLSSLEGAAHNQAAAARGEEVPAGGDTAVPDELAAARAQHVSERDRIRRGNLTPEQKQAAMQKNNQRLQAVFVKHGIGKQPEEAPTPEAPAAGAPGAAPASAPGGAPVGDISDEEINAALDALGDDAQADAVMAWVMKRRKGGRGEEE